MSVTETSAARRAEKDEARRRLIVECAHRLFMRLGPRRATMDELARELRISKKTLYRCFPDKDALVWACMERITGAVIPAVLQALDGPGDFATRMTALGAAWRTLSQSVSAEFIRDLKSEHPHVWEEIVRRRRVVLDRVAALFEEGRREGRIRPEIHPQVAVALARAFVERVMVPETFAQGEFSPADVFTTLQTLVLRGAVRLDPPSEEP